MLKVLELFGGIGACSNALKRLGIDFEITDYVEIDKYAVKSYNAIYGTNFETQDITTWNKDLDIDLIMHGSPCQDFSLAGKQAGGDIDSGTRSSLMWHTVRIVEKLKPKYVVWENVKNVLSKKHKHNFDAYIEKMEQLGYTNYYQVLNAKDYGIPQNRERVFTVSILNGGEFNFPQGIECGNKIKVLGNYMPSGHDASRIVDEEGIAPTVKENHGTVTAVAINFKFPEKEQLKLKLKDLLEDEVDEKYYLSDEQINNIKYSTFTQNQRRIQEKEYCDTLCARDWKDPKCIQVRNTKSYDKYSEESLKRIKQNIIKGEITNTITANAMQSFNHNNCALINSNLRIRKLTPKECWRLMGFDDEDFEKAEKVNSNTQLYKQAGNSIVVDVLVKIFTNLFKEKKWF